MAQGSQATTLHDQDQHLDVRVRVNRSYQTSLARHVLILLLNWERLVGCTERNCVVTVYGATMNDGSLVLGNMPSG